MAMRNIELRVVRECLALLTHQGHCFMALAVLTGSSYKYRLR